MALAQDLRLPCGQVLPNRLCKAALTEGLADPLSRPTEDIYRLYEAWGAGGCGLLISGNCQVDRRFMERPGNVAIDGPQDTAARERLQKYATAAKSGGSRVWMQLSHGGRQSDKRVNKHVVGPSAIASADRHPETPSDATTSALELEEVRDVAQRFIDAAVVCEACGFDGVQLHSAHGYLLSSFLNPRANVREDEYGGALENRARLLLEVVRGIRSAVAPTFALGVKINSADFQKGGFTDAECATVVQWLEASGVDLIEVSGGNYENPVMMSGKTVRESTRLREGYFLEFTDKIRAALARTPLMVSGGFRSRRFMERCLADGKCDVIGIGRPLCVLADGAKQLLDGTLEALPDFEDPVPWYMWPLYWTKMGPLTEVYMHLLWFERCILDYGAGLERPPPNWPLGDMLAVRRHDNEQAKSLQGLGCVGTILNAKARAP